MLIESLSALLVVSAVLGLVVATFLAMAREDAKRVRRSPFGDVTFN